MMEGGKILNASREFLLQNMQNASLASSRSILLVSILVRSTVTDRLDGHLTDDGDRRSYSPNGADRLWLSSRMPSLLEI